MKKQNKAFSALLAIFVFAVFLMFSCKQSTELDDKTRTELIEKGTRISTKLSGALQQKLSSEIQENGLVEAIKYCTVHALPLTDSLSNEEHVRISRVSHNNRNPKNTINPDEVELSKKYISQLEQRAPLAPTIVTKDGQHIFYSPIIISMPTCLKCHGKTGSDIDPQVMQVLQEQYPNDKATGFEMGQLRGLFKIEFDKN